MKFRLLTGSACAALLLSSAPALAAAQPEQAVPDAGSVDTGEIIVTAQKRREALEKVPISISAISSETLEQSSVEVVKDLPQAVPALRVNYAGTFVLPTIRGVGSIVALPGLVQNIATYVDGFYVPTPSASNFELVNVESVSVLKGPQGTLFGANATGGAIMITTKRPQQETSGMFKVGYGSYDHVNADVYATTGLAEGIAADIAASYEYGNGAVTNIVNGDKHVGQFKKWSVRPKLMLTPSDGINFILAYEHSYSDDPSTQLVVPRNGISLGHFVPGTTITFDSPRRVALDNPGYARRKYDAFTLTSEFDLGFADLTSYTGYRKDAIDQALDYDATSAPLNFSNWFVRDKTFTQELDLASKPGGPLSWVVGGFYMHYKDAYRYFTNGAAIFTSQNETKSYAVFADATYQLTDKLYFTAGGRYTEDHPDVAFDLIVANFQAAGGTKFTNFSVRSVLRYEMTPDSSLYASFSQGYRSGGLPASAFSLVPVKPEHIDAFEVGYKTASGPLRLSVAGFYYNYKDIQVTSYGAGGASQTVNAGKSRIYGLDGELTYQVTPDLSVSLSGSYTHAEYVDFPNALGRVMITDPLDPRFGQIVTVNVNADGFRVERTPRFSGSAAVNYGFDMAGGRMKLNANLFYSGAYFFDPAHQFSNPEYALLNLRATWTDPSDHFDLSVYGKNVTNSKYFVSTFIDPYAARARYGDPATFGASIAYRF